MSIIVLVLTLLSTPVAQSEDDVIAKYVASNRVVEEHAILDRMVGDWSAVQRLFAAPGEPPLEAPASARGESRFGGRFVFLSIEAQSMGKDVEVLTIFGYDVHHQRYTAVAIGENGTSMYTSSGAYDVDTRTLDLRGEMDDAIGKRPVRYTFRFDDDDRFLFTAFDTVGGEEYRVVEIEYSRADATGNDRD